VLAWSVAEGDVLPGGETVLSVLRDPAADRSPSPRPTASGVSCTGKTGW
jgi:hypothetical protein